MTRDDIIPGDDRAGCAPVPCAACDPFVALGGWELVSAVSTGGLSLTSSYLSPLTQRSLSGRKFHFVTTSPLHHFSWHITWCWMSFDRGDGVKNSALIKHTRHTCPVNICEVLNLKVKSPCSLVLTIVHGSLLCGNHQSPEASPLSSGQRSTGFHHIAGGATHPCLERGEWPQHTMQSRNVPKVC